MRRLVSSLTTNRQRSGVTHACCLDLSSDVGKKLFILLGIFAPDEDMERNFPTLQRFQMLG
jgi:hypothetical protein